jgi:hypothetical protein
MLDARTIRRLDTLAHWELHGEIDRLEVLIDVLRRCESTLTPKQVRATVEMYEKAMEYCAGRIDALDESNHSVGL